MHFQISDEQIKKILKQRVKKLLKESINQKYFRDLLEKKIGELVGEQVRRRFKTRIAIMMDRAIDQKLKKIENKIYSMEMSNREMFKILKRR